MAAFFQRLFGSPCSEVALESSRFAFSLFNYVTCTAYLTTLRLSFFIFKIDILGNSLAVQCLGS